MLKLITLRILSRYLSRYTATLLLLFIVPIMIGNADAANATDARQFVDNLGKKVVATVSTTNIDENQKQKRLQQMFTENVDIPWMGQFALGRTWQQAKPEQRDRYLQAYKQYMIARYTTNFSDYSGAKYTITDVNNEQDGQFTVNMQIKTPNESQDTSAAYRLHANNNGQFKITDIIIEGVSLVTTQRSEFSSVVQEKGMDGLISDIDNKIKTELSPVKS